MSLYIKDKYIVSDETERMREITKRNNLYFYYVVGKDLWEDNTPLIATGTPAQEGEHIEGEVQYLNIDGIGFLVLIKTLEHFHKTPIDCEQEPVLVPKIAGSVKVKVGEITPLELTIPEEEETDE